MLKNPWLETAVFKQVVQHAPLISIDLLIYNGNNEVLLGQRKNQPARGSWFVPGGRIMKDESIRSAFSRIVLSEVGIAATTDQAVFHGVYEHFYEGENFASEPGFGTHYIVIAFELKLEEALPTLPMEQHGNYQWFSIPGLLQDEGVHRHVKNYFNGLETF
jgi:colanic acid biosynthesis protein WcaH